MEWNDKDDDVSNMSWDTDTDEEATAVEAAEVGPTNGDLASIAGPSGGVCEAAQAGPSCPSWISRFVGMGFSEEMVVKAVKANGEDDTDAILDTLLTYQAIEEKSPSPNCSTLAADREKLDQELHKDTIVSTLVAMGFPAEEAASTIDSCGLNASILELADHISAAQMQQESDEQRPYPSSYLVDENKKRRGSEMEREMKRNHYMYDRSFDDGEPSSSVPKPMVETGLQFEGAHSTDRKLPEALLGPPYFYFENFGLAKKGFNHIEPEYIDSRFFSPLMGKRGYVHNLPIANRSRLLPLPPTTIQEAIPMTKKYWPKWDPRTQLNCLQTGVASVQLVSRIGKALTGCGDPPPRHILSNVLSECRKWNLVWVGHRKVDRLDPDEMETLLGYPRNHTRGGGLSLTERYKSLGSSFQVDTLAYHLSVLKDVYPGGMNVLSLFSGIGGAEVALHKLGIRLNTVVSLELSQVNRNILRGWWEQTNESGNLVQIADVQELSAGGLKILIDKHGRFNLVIGGNPFSNIEGSNKQNYNGSDLFNHYFRILNLVTGIMGRKK